MPELSEVEEYSEFIKECKERLDYSKKIAEIVALEFLVQKSDSFEVLEDKQWEKIKFEALVVRIIKAIAVPEKKQLLLDTFN